MPPEQSAALINPAACLSPVTLELVNAVAAGQMAVQQRDQLIAERDAMIAGLQGRIQGLEAQVQAAQQQDARA